MHSDVSSTTRNTARMRRGGALGLILCVVGSLFSAVALDANEAQRMLERADTLKMGHPDEFDALLDRVANESRDLPRAQAEYLRYLRGYQATYRGHFDEALSLLESLERETSDPTLKFRATATIANVHVVATRYELAYARLRPLLDLLPKVTDPAARQQGMAVAAYLYNQVGEYGLALSYADRIIEEDWGNGACRGAQLRVEALYRSGTAEPSDPEFQTSADKCLERGEPLIARGIRVHYARLLVDREIDEALEVLTTNYDTVVQARYPRVISEYSAIMAEAFRQKGDMARARQYALKSLEEGVEAQYTEPLVMAYHTLYLVARASGDQRAALDYHEKFAAADKGYLDELSARQLAYERIKHSAEENRLLSDAQHSQNELLSVQRELAAKSTETMLLYAVLGLLIVLLVVTMLLRRTRSTQ